MAAAFADAPRSADEQKMVEKVRAMYASKGLPFTQADEDTFLQRMRDVQGRAIQNAVLMGQQAQNVAAGVPQSNVLPVASMGAASMDVVGASLADQIKAHETTKAPVAFERRQDGFVANGRLVVDPSGTITQFAGDSRTGDVTYFVDQGQGHFLVRFNNVNSTLPPVSVGEVSLISGARFTGVDGQVVAGDTILPVGTGLIISRQGSLFVTQFGGAVSAQALPTGFAVAPLQHGDVGGTGYVLLRKTSQAAQADTNLLKTFGSLVKDVAGHSDAQDYALLNVHNGHLVNLNRSIDSDKVGQGTGCKGKGVVHKCSGWEAQDSLFETDGMPNFGHYYWAVQWMVTSDGPTAVVMENGVREVNVYRLDSGERANAFQRQLGITGFIVQPTADGSLSINGKWMFQDHVVADVRTLFTGGGSPGAHPATGAN